MQPVTEFFFSLVLQTLIQITLKMCLLVAVERMSSGYKCHLGAGIADVWLL